MISTTPTTERGKRKKDGNACVYCRTVFTYPKRLLTHEAKCAKREKLLNTSGFRRGVNDAGKTSLKKARVGYSCIKCGQVFKNFKIGKMIFHKCSNPKMRKTKKKMDRCQKLYSKIDMNNASRKVKKDLSCFTCGKIFPSKELCFAHYRKKFCKNRVDNSVKNQGFYRCNICHKYYKLHSALQRHLRTHAYNDSIMKKMAKKSSNLRGGGRILSASDDSNDSSDDDTTPLSHLSGNEPILPETWGWSTHTVNLNTPDFDGDLLNDLINREIKSQIEERRKTIRRDADDDVDEVRAGGDRFDLLFDERYSTLSMIAVLKVMFYKVNLGADLGETNQNTSQRRKPIATKKNQNRDDHEVIIDAYFHSSPAKLLEGNIEEEVRLIIENFDLQIDEYTNMKSGLKLFKVAQCELNFYNYESMWGGRLNEGIPPHCYTTLHALYDRGKILHISTDKIGEYLNYSGEKDVYTDNCFKHVLAGFNYIKSGYETQRIPTEFESGTGYVLKHYTEIHVRDVMRVELEAQSLAKYDFSMCFDGGRAMRLNDISKFYRVNHEKNGNAMPYINVFTLEYVDESDFGSRL